MRYDSEQPCRASSSSILTMLSFSWPTQVRIWYSWPGHVSHEAP
ncbi:MAG: hypothetical protein ACYDDU_02585 [Dermatophilaceae bacterium]